MSTLHDADAIRRVSPGSEPSEQAAYDTLLRYLARTPYLDYPKIVHLETLALCPAACSFCPYPTLPRKGARMDDQLIDKVLTDLEDIPRQLPFQLFPLKLNEPFLDKRLIPLLRQINRRLPNAQLTLISSGAPLTEAKALELTDIFNLHYLSISLNAHTPELYSNLMQLPWERTLERLEMLHRLLEQNRLPFQVLLTRVPDGSPDDEAFMDWCRERFPLMRPIMYQRGHWLGQIDGYDRIGEVPDVGCQRWFELSITATGTVSYCCMDGHSAWPLGDVSRQHVLEIYNQPALRRQREQSLSRRLMAPCNQCTFM